MAIFTTILGAIVGKLTTSVVSKGFTEILGGMRQINKDRLAAANDKNRVDADKYIAGLDTQEKLWEMQAAIVMKEQGSWKTSWIRPAFAFPFVFYNTKVIVWDMCLGLGSTPALNEQMFWVEVTIVGSYFLGRPVEKLAKKFM